MKKAVLMILIGILVVSSFILMSSCSKKEDVITIGAILPLTGDGAQYGEEDKNGFELALSEYEGSNQIKIIYEDDKGTSSGGVNAFNKLYSVDKVPVIIGLMYSSVALSVAPLGDENKVVLFSTTASSPELTNAGDYFFRNWPSDVFEGKEIAEFTFNKLNLRKGAIFTVNLDYGVGLKKVFKNVFESLGGEITKVEYYNQGDSDFKTQLKKIQAVNPDFIYLPGYYNEIGQLLKQAKELGIKAQFISCVGFDNPKILEIAGNAAEGVIFARPTYNPNSNEPIVNNFVNNYEKVYGQEPGVYAAHAYDALKILTYAIDSGGYSSEGIKNAIYEIQDFPGVTGLTSFDENGDVIKPIQIMKVSNQEFMNF